MRLRLPVDDVVFTRESQRNLCGRPKIPKWTELGEQQTEKIKAQTVNVLRHPNVSASDARKKIDKTDEAIAPSEKRKTSKKLPDEDAETKRLRNRVRAAITARSRETADDLRQQLERRRQEWVNTQRKEVNDRSIKLAAHQPAALLDLLKEEGQAWQLTHAVRDKVGKLLTKADEVHARLEQAWQFGVFGERRSTPSEIFRDRFLLNMSQSAGSRDWLEQPSSNRRATRKSTLFRVR